MTNEYNHAMKSYRRKDISIMHSSKDEMHRKHVIESMLERHDNHAKPLNEMSLPLKEYVKRIENLMYQIAENWCLCKWCQMFDPRNENFNHWKEELAAHLIKLSSPKLKNNIGKKKHLEKYLVEWYDLDEKDMVLDVIDYKFDKEHIMDISQRNAVADAFANGIHVLIDAMSDGHDVCKSYIANTFGA